jgi:hypothetical protein
MVSTATIAFVLSDYKYDNNDDNDDGRVKTTATATSTRPVTTS